MALIQVVPKTDLARKTRQVIQAVQRGHTTIIESHGQPEAAIIDIIDYRIMRAVINYHAQEPDVNLEKHLQDQRLEIQDDPQERFNQVLAQYLAKVISLGRAAELLELPWIDLRLRFARLDVPVFVGPENRDDLVKEIRDVEKWEINDEQANPE
jgi:prevent-host-death family protein